MLLFPLLLGEFFISFIANYFYLSALMLYIDSGWGATLLNRMMFYFIKNITM